MVSLMVSVCDGVGLCLCPCQKTKDKGLVSAIRKKDWPVMDGMLVREWKGVCCCPLDGQDQCRSLSESGGWMSVSLVSVRVSVDAGMFVFEKGVCKKKLDIKSPIGVEKDYID